MKKSIIILVILLNIVLVSGDTQDGYTIQESSLRLSESIDETALPEQLVFNEPIKLYVISFNTETKSLNHPVYVSVEKLNLNLDKEGYVFEIISISEELIVSYPLSIQPVEGNIDIKIPYFDNADKINVYDTEKNLMIELNVKQFSNLCEDNICGEGENHLSCPQDCPSGQADNYCDKVSEGICDPDCITGDPDCEIAELKKEKAQVVDDQSKAIVILIISFVVFIFFFVLIEFLRKNRMKKVLKEQLKQEELELKTYISYNLSRGYTRDQIKEGLLRDGWKEILVDKAFEAFEEKPKSLTREHILALKTYISTNLQKGYTRDQIEAELVRDGWPKHQIDEIFSNT